MSKSHPTETTYLLRGLLYALTTIPALVSGYLLRSQALPSLQDLFTLLIPFFLSYTFCVAYVICFFYQDPEAILSHDLLRTSQRRALGVGTAVGLVLSVFAVSASYLASNAYSHRALFTTLVQYLAAYGCYTLFLRRHLQQPEKLTIRHQLVWPAVLTIAASLYFGFHFADLSVASAGVPWIGVLFAYVLLIEAFRLSKAVFTTANLLVYFTAAFAVVSGACDNPSLRFLLFAIAVAAYLAVFEAWRVTSHQSSRERHESLHTQGGRASNAERFYIATYWALIVSGLVIPLLYVFGDVGGIFLVGLAIETVVAYVLWFFAGHRRGRLRSTRWEWMTIVFGTSCLALLVLDSLLASSPTGHFMEKLVGFTPLGVVAAVAFFPLVPALRAVKEERRKHGWLFVYKRRIRFVHTVVFLSLLLASVILLVHAGQMAAEVTFRAERAYAVYMCFTILGLIYLLLNSLRLLPKGLRTVTLVSGVLLAARVPTALGVFAIVFVPSVVSGSAIRSSIASAGPFVLAALGGFLLNDSYDAERDAINKPHRPIPRGKLSRRTAYCTGMVFLGFGGLSILGALTIHVASAWQFLAVVGVAFYNIVVGRTGYLKTAVSGLLCSSILAHNVTVLPLPEAFVWLPVGAFWFIVGREVLMDVLDRVGDEMAGTKTLAVLIGKPAQHLGFMAQLVGGACLACLAMTLKSPSVWLCLGSWTVATGLLAFLWYRNTLVSRQQVVLLMWIPMLIGIAPIVVV